MVINHYSMTLPEQSSYRRKIEMLITLKVATNSPSPSKKETYIVTFFIGHIVL